MAVRVTLDNTVLNNTPRGWETASITSKRDNDIRGLLNTYTSELEFYGDGFDYIDTILNQNYCQVIDVLIETDDCDTGNWIVEFIGTIPLTKITKYDVSKRIITTAILDESFDAKIRNNKSIKAFVDVGLSKNGENIQACSPVTLRLFRPTDRFALYNGNAVEGWRVFDCFRFIIDYMTDGQVGFKSDIFSGDYYNWMLVNGKELRVGNGNGDQLEVCFKDLFMELHKKTNLSFAIEPTPTGYMDTFQLRLEPTSYFEPDEALLTLSNVVDILMSFNKDELYSHIEVGSKEFDDNVILSYPPINFKAFKEENYTIQGQCNIDKALDLVSKYIIDTNIIEDIRVNSVSKYDKKTFLIVCDSNGDAIKYKEYDNPLAAGVDDGGVAFRLTDSTANFNTAGVTSSCMVVNLLTGLRTGVVSVDVGGQFINLVDSIFNNGDPYQIRDKPFSYNHPLTNIKVVERFLGGLPNSVIKQYSTSSTANFYAGIVSDILINSFPTTTNPMPYADDFTLPFFDDGGNFSIINNDYTVPNSGLYGFESTLCLRLNGQLDTTNLVVNGDFSTTTDWSHNAQISSGKFRVNVGWLQANQIFLRQLRFPTGGDKYLLTFDCTISKGGIRVKNGILYDLFTTTGSYSVILDHSQVSNPYPYLEFSTYSTAAGVGAECTIDNVLMIKLTKFNIEHSMVRCTSTGTQLQIVTKNQPYWFDYNEFQREVVFTFQQQIPLFVGERVKVKTVISNTSGNNTKVVILANLFSQINLYTFITGLKTTMIDDGGGDLVGVDPDDFPIYEYKFKKGIKFADFKLLKDAPEKAVLFSKNTSNYLFGWRNLIKYDRETGEAEFELRSKKKINGDC